MEIRQALALAQQQISLQLTRHCHCHGHRRADRQCVQSKLSKKAPYSQYSDLESEGVKVIFGSPEDKAALPDGKFDYIYDNNAKALEVNQGLIDLAKVIPPPPACPCAGRHSMPSDIEALLRSSWQRQQ